MVACFAFSAPVHAAQTVPYKVNFQGRLTNASGTVLTGTYDMQFKLYTALTGGTLIWSETRTAANSNAVTVTNGLFSVLIGEGTAVAGSSATLQAAVTANATMYMEVVVGSETLSPRSQFGSAAYAINSDMLDGYDSSYFAPATGSTAYAPMSGSTNYAPISGSANYIQNQTASAQSAGFNVSGNGTIGGTGTVTGGFTNNGAALFYNSTNSASAFTVQTSTASKLFVIDTSASRVYVGNPTGDSTGIVLVLDNSTAEPAGTNGAEYYNSTNNRFRCYEGGVWKNCTNGDAYMFTTASGTAVATAAKTANAMIIVSPLYVSGRITVNSMIVRVTAALGATGDVGIYNSAGTRVLNGGSGTLSTATGVKTIAPAQTGTARILEPGQYYIAMTWNSTTGVVGGVNLASAGTIPRSGTIATGGGSVLPATITLTSITNTLYLYGMTITN